MPRIPILAGVYVDSTAAVRIAYPVNMVPVPTQDSIAEGSLRPAEGVKYFTLGQGLDRGGIVVTGGTLSGIHFRVSGTSLVSISATGVVTVIGDVGGSGPVRMDFAFDRLAVASNGLLYYWDGVTLTHVTDVNIGTVLDVVWVDGYFMVTDGTNVVVTELVDPAAVNPVKYGNTDEPDPVQCLLKVRNEVHVVSQHFIDVFQDVGGALFPFQRLPTARISKGAVGKKAACVFQDSVVFVGTGKSSTSEEAPSIYRGANAQFVKISTREIDNLLLQYTTAQLATITMQSILDRGSEFVYVNLPDRTIVYDASASVVAQQPVWCILTSGLDGFAQYRAINMTRAYGVWVAGDPQSSSIGIWTTDDSNHWGSPVRWEFSTGMLRNDGKGAQIHQLELDALTGVVPETLDGYEPMVATSFSIDGVLWTQDRSVKSGKKGNRTIRLVWFQQGIWRKFRIQRFRGDSTSRLTAMGINAEIEALKV